MKPIVKGGLLAASAILMMAHATQVFAWQLKGHVTCESGKPVAGVVIRVVSTDSTRSFSAPGISDSNGYYVVHLLETPMCYRTTAELPRNRVVSPSAGDLGFCMTNATGPVCNWVVHGCGASPPPAPESRHWWVTGGGTVKLANGRHSFGGNVHTGCGPNATSRGQWTHIAHDLGPQFKA